MIRGAVGGQFSRILYYTDPHSQASQKSSRNVFFQKTMKLPHTWSTSLGGVLSPKFTRKYRRIKDWKN